MNVLIGIHPVREALLAGRPLERVLVARGTGGQRLQEIIELCRASGTPVRFEERRQLEKLAEGGVHQGVVALDAARRYAGLDQILESSELVVVLDGVEDPHNLGAVLRTADAAGAGGVLIPERRSAGMTPAAAKASAGAMARVPVARVVNLGRALDEMKQRGYWIYGLDERGKESYDTVEYARPTAFILGREGKGIHEQIRKRCDFLVRIPLAGQLSSLNVSVACGVALFEWKRRRTPE